MNEIPEPRRTSGHTVRELAPFASVEGWIFDLDNTLYPRHANLFLQVDQRIHDYVGRLLNMGPTEAHAVQKDYYRRYGTTLRGLMEEHGVKPDDFLEFVHDIDHSVVQPDPRLAAALQRLPGRKFIFTNGSKAHAEKVAARLGVTDHFEDIFDIVRARLMPKPNRETYDGFIAETGIDPARAAMFEDLSRNLAVPSALGMRTVLVVPGGTAEVFHEEWEVEGREEAFVEFLTDDLGAFLDKVLEAIAASRP